MYYTYLSLFVAVIKQEFTLGLQTPQAHKQHSRKFDHANLSYFLAAAAGQVLLCLLHLLHQG